MKRWYKPKGKSMVLLDEEEINMLIKGEKPIKKVKKKEKKEKKEVE